MRPSLSRSSIGRIVFPGDVAVEEIGRIAPRVADVIVEGPYGAIRFLIEGDLCGSPQIEGTAALTPSVAGGLALQPAPLVLLG